MFSRSVTTPSPYPTSRSATPASSEGISRSSSRGGEADTSPLLGSSSGQAGVATNISPQRRAGDRRFVAWVAGKLGEPKDPLSQVATASAHVTQPTRRHRTSAIINPHNQTDDSSLPAIRQLKRALEKLDLGNAEHRGALEATLTMQSDNWHTLTPAAKEKLQAVFWRYLAPGKLTSYSRLLNVPKNVRAQRQTSGGQPGTGTAIVSQACVLTTLGKLLSARAPGDVLSALRIHDLLALANIVCVERKDLDMEGKMRLLTLMVRRSGDIREPLKDAIASNARLRTVMQRVNDLAGAALGETTADTPGLEAARNELGAALGATPRSGGGEGQA